MQLLERLRSAVEPVSAQSLANSLGVSERTVRSHLKTLDQDLKGQGAVVRSKTGVGYWLEISDEEALEDLLREADENNTFFAVNTVRQARAHLLVRYFLCQEDYVSMEELEDVLFMGRTAVRQVLTRARGILGRSGLELVSRPRQGMILSGSEHDIRTCIAYEADQIHRYRIPLTARERYAEIYNFRGEKMDLIQALVCRALGKRVGLSEYSVMYLARLIWISAIRSGVGARPSYPEDMARDLEESSFHGAVRVLLEDCGQVLECGFDPADVLMLTAAVRGLRTVTVTEEIGARYRPGLRKAAGEVIRELSRQNGFQAMDRDEALRDQLTCYLAGLFRRSQYHIRTAQISREMVDRCSLMAKKLAIQAFIFMEKRYKVNISEEEIHRLAMVLRPAFGRFPREPRKVRACCVSNVDRSVGRAVAERLRRNFGKNIEQMEVLELYELRECGGAGYDVVFTSYPPEELDFLAPEVLRIPVGPYFNEVDKSRILHALNDMDQLGDFAACWRPECLFTEVEASGQEECLEVIQRKLKTLGPVKGKVKEDLLRCEGHAPSRPVNNAVILSGLQSHLPRLTAAVFLLKKPIQWGAADDRAQVVVYWDQGEEAGRYQMLENEFLPHVLEMVFYDRNVVDALLKKPDYDLVLRAIRERDKEVMTLSSSF